MFFSVKRGMKIGGKVFQPCICYPVTKVLETTIEKLADEGKVVVYKERVAFQNGKVIEPAKVVEETKVIKKKIIKKTTVEKEAEEADLPTEIETAGLEPVDESEGF